MALKENQSYFLQLPKISSPTHFGQSPISVAPIAVFGSEATIRDHGQVEDQQHEQDLLSMASLIFGGNNSLKAKCTH